MTDVIVESRTILTLLGGGATYFGHRIQALSKEMILIAADSGADAALDLGVIPDLVIGDMDSISPAALAAIPADRQLSVAEQDSTDFEKCLSRVAAPLIEAYGFTGGRIDHELAACSVLARYAHKRVILVGSDDLICLAPPEISLELPSATRLSLFPLAPVRGQSKGLLYPIDGIEMMPTGRIGTSNQVTGPVHLRVDRPAMLLFVPSDHLDTLRSAFMAAPAHWQTSRPDLEQ